MKPRRLSPFVAILLVLSLALPGPNAAREGKAAAPTSEKGAVILYTVPPKTVCVGDRFTIQGGAYIDMPDFPPTSDDFPLAPLLVINLSISTALGSAAPTAINESSGNTYFSFTYTAKAAGDETIKVTENNGVAFDQLRFKVAASCTYDAFLVTVMDFTAPLGNFDMHTLTNVTGMGTMQRVRSTEDILQGDGTWRLEENMLNQPPECVQWYMPPLLVDGPFELDGQVRPEDETVNVILAFKPRTGPPVYHGKSICVDANGDQGEGWGIIPGGGDETKAAKIQADFPIGGGSQQVELTGAGIKIVQSVGSLEYTANLTILPR